MKYHITITSAILALVSFAASQQGPVDPQKVIPVNQCIKSDLGNTTFYNFMNHFTGIFLNDFVTNDRHSIAGPLAVGGTARIPGYSVNSHNYGSCSTRDTIARLGLYANTLASPASLRITGDINVKNNPTLYTYINNNIRCRLAHTFDSFFTFANIWKSGLQMSQFLIDQIPTHVLRSDDSLSKIYDTQDQRFWVLHFGPCDEQGCAPDGELVSSASRILLGDGSWEGPSGGYPQDRMIVFNVAIKSGHSMSITTDKPTAGLSGCRAIYNFYSIDPDTGDIGSADVNIHRLTSDPMGGLVMNLYGGISDGPEGYFAGQLVGKSYKWEDTKRGVDIMDYEDNCNGKFTCWIPTNVTNYKTDDYTTVATVSETSTSFERTTTDTLTTRFVATTTDVVTETYEVDSDTEEDTTTSLTETNLVTVTDDETLTDVTTETLITSETLSETTTSTIYTTVVRIINTVNGTLSITATDTVTETTFTTSGTTSTTTTTVPLYSTDLIETTTTTTVIQLLD